MSPHSRVPDISCPFSACSVSQSCLLAPGALCALLNLPNFFMPPGTMHSNNTVRGRLPNPATANKPPPIENTRAHTVEREVPLCALHRQNSLSNIKTHSAHMGSRDSPVDGMHFFSPPLPAFPAAGPKFQRGYTKATKAPVPFPAALAFLTHNLAKQAPTGQILWCLQQGYDILFFQDVIKKPLVPHQFSLGCQRAVVIANVSKKHEHGACLVLSPKLQPFTEPPPPTLTNKALNAAALLHLPGARLTLLASVYAPYKSARAHTARFRHMIQQTLLPLLLKYLSQPLAGDFNTLITPSMDGHNINAFPWGAWPRDAAVDTHKEAGRQSTALTGASSCSCHVTKRFRILATLKQGNKSMYSNTSRYVHMGLRLDWSKGNTGE